MTTIKQVAVIGSGVMGAGIAAHIANAGVPVLLLDIVPEGASDKNQLTKAAIGKLLESNPAALTHKRRAKLITAGNLQDDFSKLKDVDWIIEVVVEKLDVKQNLYKTLDAHRKAGSIVSSNTSTLPLHSLTSGMSEQFQKDFLITHFFNPPRYMALLELVTGAHTRPDAAATIRHFCDVQLGKGVVECKDTPGFIANRIGCFWLQCALNHAIAMNVPVEVADAVMGKPVGIPKTGVFGLMDLIGIDLLPLIAKSFRDTLPPADEFLKIYTLHPQVEKMIAEGYTGRKGKGGFYRLNTDGGKKAKEVLNLQTGQYQPQQKEVKLGSVEAAKTGLHALVSHHDQGAAYAWAVLRDTLAYAASLMPEIADDIARVDEAMRLGYNWKYGPFELIDRFKNHDLTGTAWFAKKLREEGLPVPRYLEHLAGKPCYHTESDRPQYMGVDGVYKPIPVPEGAWMLADKKRSAKPILKNPSAALWDVGDGIACFEFTGKMNTLDPMVIELIQKSTEEVKKNFRGMIIGNDGDNFSVGANIGVLLFASNVAAWHTVNDIIKQGQDALMGLKYAPFPVVGAPAGMALGGGCEILLHCDAVNAHVELYAGLVEVGIGAIPGWGGCKETLYRSLKARAESDALSAKFGRWFSGFNPVKTLNTMPAIEPVFRNISTARVSKSAEDAWDMFILNDKSRITMNRRRVLPDAKNLCLELAQNYQPPVTHSIQLPGKTARVALDMAIKGAAKSGQALPHDVVVSTALGWVLSGGETDITKELTEQQVLDLERERFVELCKHPNTLARIEHMLEHGKPLRN